MVAQYCQVNSTSTISNMQKFQGDFDIPITIFISIPIRLFPLKKGLASRFLQIADCRIRQAFVYGTVLPSCCGGRFGLFHDCASLWANEAQIHRGALRLGGPRWASNAKSQGCHSSPIPQARLPTFLFYELGSSHNKTEPMLRKSVSSGFLNHFVEHIGLPIQLSHYSNQS